MRYNDGHERKFTIKKNCVSVNLNSIVGQNRSTMFYLNSNRIYPGCSTTKKDN